MTRGQQDVNRRIVAVVVAALLLGCGAIAAGLRYNGSGSFPVGLYLASHRSPHRGDLVFVSIAELPVFKMAKERGYLNVAYSATTHLLKRLVGVAGDRVTISAEGVDVNGLRLANSAPLPRDGAGRPLVPYPLKDYIMRRGEVLLMSDYSPASFDARYFGTIPSATIESVVMPLLTF